MSELVVREAGTGSPILLLHGLGGDHTVWNLVAPALEDQHRVLLPDLRGHGRSEAPESSGWTFPELRGDIVRLLEQRDLGPAHVVGLSAGGFLALDLTLSRPDLIRSLITVGAAAQCDGHTRAVGQRWAETYQQSGYEAYLLRLVKDLFYPDWLEAHLEVLDRLKSQPQEVDPRAVIGWGQAIRKFDVRGQLGKINVPTLVIHGMDDRVVDPSHARYLRQSIRGAEMRLLKDTGHMAPIERPKEIEEAIRTWTARADGTPI